MQNPPTSLIIFAELLQCLSFDDPLFFQEIPFSHSVHSGSLFPTHIPLRRTELQLTQSRNMRIIYSHFLVKSWCFAQFLFYKDFLLQSFDMFSQIGVFTAIFIHSLTKYLLSDYHVPGSVQGAGNTPVNK